MYKKLKIMFYAQFNQLYFLIHFNSFKKFDQFISLGFIYLRNVFVFKWNM